LPLEFLEKKQIEVLALGGMETKIKWAALSLCTHAVNDCGVFGKVPTMTLRLKIR
jgi:hypothetical protein